MPKKLSWSNVSMIQFFHRECTGILPHFFRAQSLVLSLLPTTYLILCLLDSLALTLLCVRLLLFRPLFFSPLTGPAMKNWPGPIASLNSRFLPHMVLKCQTTTTQSWLRVRMKITDETMMNPPAMKNLTGPCAIFVHSITTQCDGHWEGRYELTSDQDEHLSLLTGCCTPERLIVLENISLVKLSREKMCRTNPNINLGGGFFGSSLCEREPWLA